MGAMLVVFGICLLWGAVKGYSLVSYVLDWWPLTLVLLGLEVILYTYLRKTERLNYDLMSMAIIFVIGVGGFGLYALQSVGIVETAQRMLTQSVYEVELNGETLPNHPAIRKVVIDNPGDARLTINNVKDTPGKITGHLQVRTSNREEAELQRDFDIATVTEQGEQLFIHVKHPTTATAFGSSNGGEEAVTLFIPSAWSVEVRNGYQPLTLRTLNPEGSWVVHSDGRVDVTLDGQNAVSVEARTRGGSNLGGNVPWTVESLQTRKQRNGTTNAAPSGTPVGAVDAADAAQNGGMPAPPAMQATPDVDRIDRIEGALRGLYSRGTGGAKVLIEARSIRVTDAAAN
jgi:hypothetical protein